LGKARFVRAFFIAQSLTKTLTSRQNYATIKELNFSGGLTKSEKQTTAPQNYRDNHGDNVDGRRFSGLFR
jgi:hypothetical protein